jgi:hypothetical protein
MKYLIIFLIVILFLCLLIIYPFKIIIYNQNNYLFINISNFITLKINLFVLFDNNHNEEIKKQAKGARIITKVKFKEINIDIKGLNFDYKLNGAYYGIIYALLGFIDKLLETKNIKFNYNASYLGDKYIEFKSVFRIQVIKVIPTLI